VEENVRKTAEVIFKKTFPDKEISELSVREGQVWWTALVIDAENNQYHFSVDSQTIYAVTGAY
jgi:hypothetical protein